MTRIDLFLTGAEMKAKVSGPLTSGMIGVRVHIHYDKNWDGLLKTLVCRSSAGDFTYGTVRTVLNIGETARVAHEVMIAGRTLFLGIEGRSTDGVEVYPTVWADCGKILPGANANADQTVQATPEAWEQTQMKMGSLNDLHTQDKSSLVAAINEAMTKGNGADGKDGYTPVKGVDYFDGAPGNDGADGKDGYSPIKGVDYWTEEDQTELLEDCNNMIAEEIAKKSQLAPEFANSIEECTDPTKLYVLPDGYIYAYMKTSDDSNQISKSIAADGSAYNGGQGWKTGFRLNSSGVETEFDNWEVTGFIPVTIASKVYFANINFNGDGQGRDYISLYDSTFTKIASQPITEWLEGQTGQSYYNDGVRLDNNGNPTYLDFSILKLGGLAGTEKSLFDNTAYFRLSAYEITDGSVITVDEEIGSGEGGCAWTNTGHAFVSGGNDDRITELETELATQKEQITILGKGDASFVPNYVITEANSVIDRVIAAQGNRTFTFAALTDMHYGVWDYSDGITHACQAMKYIGERIELDAVAVLGDYTDGYPDDGYENAIADFKAVNTVLDDLRFAPNMRLAGNHDIYTENPALTMRYINSYSDDVVWGSRSGGYFYRDFDGYKVRVIGVNTSMLTTEQYNWFVSALDLCNKEDVKDWSILVLSHHPLDWYTDDEVYRFCYILDAYKKGTAGTANGIDYDFTNGINAAKLIGNIHGHIHNFKVDYIHFGNVNSGNKTDVLRIATPNACYNRENEYEGVWAEDTKYEKTKDTAKDTSFCIYCIDLDAGTIKAICYGAGYDREIEYGYTNDVVPPVNPELDTETWIFELADGTTVTKQMVVME